MSYVYLQLAELAACSSSVYCITCYWPTCVLLVRCHSYCKSLATGLHSYLVANSFTKVLYSP